MKKLIELDAALDALQNSHFPGAPYVDAGISIAIGVICDLPTVDAVPARHGRWIWRIWWDYPEYQYQCDQCKRWAMFESKFCPNCGAKMDWKDGEQNG